MAHGAEPLACGNQEEKMVRLAALTPLLLCLVPPSATSAAVNKVAEINAVRLPYAEQGSGEPIVFVHGALSDLRAWEPIGEQIAKKHRFIAYTQRYYGTGAWKDDGKEFGVATHADDLSEFISALNAGPVHLVGWSYGGVVATTAAVNNPSLVRSLTVYEPTLSSALPVETEEGKAAREGLAKILGPAIAASKAGDAIQAVRLMFEAVYQLPAGGFDHAPQGTRTMVLDQARTLPLLFAAPPPPAITCDVLNNFTRPTLVMWGEKTQPYFALIGEAISKCVPGAQRAILQNVHHDGPRRDPAAFSAVLFEFLAKR
jgi:pimeloyl-ACP methyl ester carboxylesterase